VPVAGSFSVMRPGIPGSDRTVLHREWPESEARRLFAAKAAGLAAAGADVIAMEIMRDGDYSLWATEAATATGLPVWLGISVEENDDGRLTGFGRPNWLLEDFVEPLLRCAPAMVCVMHSSPHDTTTALEIVRRHWRGSLGAYSESGYFAMPDWRFVDVIPEAEYADLAKQWAERFDLSMIGGCCGMGPSHIAALHRAFDTAP
jgi:homocysteine S-methyltransferase